MRRATQQALAVPTFRGPEDCSAWVLGGLWPAELAQVNSGNAAVAEYLKNDLQRIADSANYKLRVINEAGLPDPQRLAEQNRVINVARAFAVLRVESTVRHLRNESLGFAQELRSLRVADEDPTRVARAQAPKPPQPSRPLEPADQEPEVTTPDTAPRHDRAEAVVIESVREVVIPEPPTESAQQRLRRLLDGVARQEPGLRWAAGLRSDGSTVLVTDLAYGWIPPGVNLPAGVELLMPGRHSGGAKALLGATELSATYTPGDPFSGTARANWAAGRRQAPEVADLGWQLTEATRWRDGLPRITHTLAKAAASGTGVVDAELDVLRVHLDTARYQLLARYPDTEPALLLNCLLLAATEGLAVGAHDAANYHFSWFQALSAPPAGNWETGN
jgi:Family of unknown function (DUF5631)/Family of unknown function (DUF5632)